MKRHHRLAIALALAGVLCGAGSAIAQEADAPPREGSFGEVEDTACDRRAGFESAAARRRRIA